MKPIYLYTIGQASAQTGLPTHLIRVWESRYSAVSPQRSNGNRRIFCASDLKRLQLLSKAVGSGHSISQVAALSQEELVGIVGTDSTKIRRYFNENKTDSLRPEYYYQKALQLVAELDVDGLQAFWRDLLKTTVVSESAPKIVVGTPSSHRSEIGVLALALIAVESGYRSLYFGSNLPVNDVAAAVKFKGAQADLMKALSERDHHSTVSSAMQHKVEAVDSLEMLQSAFDKFKECNCHTLPVTLNRRLVGLLTMDNLGEYLRIRATMAS